MAIRPYRKPANNQNPVRSINPFQRVQVLAVIGLGLSLLHQSSLGGTYAVVIGRAALFRPTVPLLFIDPFELSVDFRAGKQIEKITERMLRPAS